MAAILTNLKAHDILFIDEIHRLNRAVEEILYPAMEDFALDIIIGKGPGAKSLRLNLPSFTLIGATTRYALLSPPLRDRFGAVYRLDFYDPPSLEKILKRSAEILRVEANEDGLKEIVKLSNLKRLYFNGSRISDEDLKYLKKLKLLQELNLSGTNVKDEGLKFLADSPNLYYLLISGNFTDEGFLSIDFM